MFDSVVGTRRAGTSSAPPTRDRAMARGERSECMAIRRPGLERRRFLQVMGAGGVVALGGGGAFLSARRVAAQVSLTPFMDPLPVPAVIRPVDVRRPVPLFHVTMQPFKQKLHRDLPPTPLWGFNAQYPGPTFEARRGRPIDVLWENNLPGRHL